MRKNKYGTYGTFSRSFSRVLAAAFVAAVAAGTMPVYSAYAASPSFARTEEEWAKLRDNVIEYDELEGLIHEYNATVQNNQYTYQKFRQDYGDTNEEVAQEYYKLAQDYYNDMSAKEIASVMGCLEGTVKSRLFTARKNLKTALMARDAMGEEALL